MALIPVPLLDFPWSNFHHHRPLTLPPSSSPHILPSLQGQVPQGERGQSGDNIHAECYHQSRKGIRTEKSACTAPCSRAASETPAIVPCGPTIRRSPLCSDTSVHLVGGYQNPRDALTPPSPDCLEGASFCKPPLTHCDHWQVCTAAPLGCRVR